MRAGAVLGVPEATAFTSSGTLLPAEVTDVKLPGVHHKASPETFTSHTECRREYWMLNVQSSSLLTHLEKAADGGPRTQVPATHR